MKRVLIGLVLFIWVGGLNAQHNVLDSLRKLKEDTGKVLAVNIAAYNMVNLGNYLTADSLARYALGLSQKLNFKHGQASSYNFIGMVYSKQGNKTEALDYYLRAMHIYKEIGYKGGLGTVYGNIGNIYYGQHKYEEAIKYHKLSLKTNLEINEMQGAIAAYGNIGLIYTEMGNYTEALQYSIHSLQLSKQGKDYFSLCANYENIGELYIKTKQFKLTQQYLDSAITLAIKIKYKEALEGAYMDKAEVYRILGDYKAAYSNYSTYVAYHDTLKNLETSQTLVKQQVKYDYNLKLEAQKAKQARIDLIKTSQTQRRNLILYSIIFIISLIALFSMVLVRNIELKRKKENQLFEQKALLANKEKELIELNKQRIEEELAGARKELEVFTNNMIEKNRLLDELKEQLEKINTNQSPINDEVKAKQLDLLTNSRILTKDDWEGFKDLFEKVHAGFLGRLDEKLPNLTQAELRLVCLTKLKLKTKDIASIIGVSQDTIRVTWFRVRKKFDMAQETSVEEVVETI